MSRPTPSDYLRNMRAVVLGRYGGPEVLNLRQVPDLRPGGHEVRVTVAATSLNRADVLQRMGKYPPPGPKPEFEIPGLEFSGIIDDVGPEVTGWKTGDRVFGLLPGGGYAEQVLTHERLLMAVPQELSLEEAAAIPEAYFTAFDALTDKAGLRPGDAVLVHAGGSGVGTAAVQLARLLGAGPVIATTRTPEKAWRLLEIGADRAAGEDFALAVADETGGRGVDVILDFVGAPYVDANFAAAALEARIVVISFLGGSHANVPLSTLLQKRLRLIGTTLRTRPVEQKMALTQRFAREVLPSIAAGRLRPVIDRTFPLEEIAEAHRCMEANLNFGKIVVTVR